MNRLSLNTSVSNFMIATNELTSLNCNKRAILEPFVVMLSPYAPHIAEGLWNLLGHTDTIVRADFPVLEEKHGIKTGRLSGISNHFVPGYLRSNQMPSYETNCIEDWEMKVDKIIDETLEKNMTLISGIPPWVQMYFDRIIERTGKPIRDVFPEFSLFVYGGVNFEPYRKKLYESIGEEIDSIELFPASEGFYAFQNEQNDPSMLLILNAGIFYEFIPADEFYNDNPTRLKMDQVKTGVNYAMVINSNAGLWGYSLGDTIKFTSLDPPKLLFTGRTKHFISAFGEHVIAEEVEKSMQHRVFENEEIRNIFTALGISIGTEEDSKALNISKLRYHKIVIMTDADVDGSHIRTLILTFFFRYMKELIEHGYLYIALPPLYLLKRGKNERYCWDESERERITMEMAVDGKEDSVSVQRYKGLGEMNPDELWDTTMDPEVRTLLQVRIEDDLVPIMTGIIKITGWMQQKSRIALQLKD